MLPSPNERACFYQILSYSDYFMLVASFKLVICFSHLRCFVHLSKKDRDGKFKAFLSEFY